MIIDPVSIWYSSHLILQSASLRWRRLQRCADIPIKAIWGSSITKQTFHLVFGQSKVFVVFFITRFSNEFLAFKKQNLHWLFYHQNNCSNWMRFWAKFYMWHPHFKKAVSRTSKSCQKLLWVSDTAIGNCIVRMAWNDFLGIFGLATINCQPIFTWPRCAANIFTLLNQALTKITNQFGQITNISFRWSWTLASSYFTDRFLIKF